MAAPLDCGVGGTTEVGQTQCTCQWGSQFISPVCVDCAIGFTGQNCAVVCPNCGGGTLCLNNFDGKLCDKCAPATYALGGGCHVCPENIWPTVIVAIFVVLGVFVALVFLDKNWIVANIRLLMNFFQFLSLLWVVRIAWPDSVMVFFAALKYVLLHLWFN